VHLDSFQVAKLEEVVNNDGNIDVAMNIRKNLEYVVVNNNNTEVDIEKNIANNNILNNNNNNQNSNHAAVAINDNEAIENDVAIEKSRSIECNVNTQPLVLKHLRKIFLPTSTGKNPVLAVKDMCLTVENGEILGLLGGKFFFLCLLFFYLY
jgi:ABC-type glutathione transport system ATPase component